MPEKLIVVGGGAGGPSAAAKAKRVNPDLNVTILEGGEHVSFSACPTPYYIGDVIRDEAKLIARTPEAFAKSGIEVKLHTRVAAIRPEQKRVEISDGETLAFDYLVVATGATPRLPGVPGQDLEGIFCLRNVTDAIRIRKFIDEKRAERAVVVGAGLISLEMCEAFRRLGLETTVVYRKDLPLRRLGEDFAEQILIELETNGVTFIGETSLEGFEPTDTGGIIVHSSGGTFETDLVLLGLGVIPQVSLASEAGLGIGSTGAISVNEFMQTNIPYVYAAGDCCECFHRISHRPVYAPLGDIANKQGRIAGANIGRQTDVTNQRIYYP